MNENKTDISFTIAFFIIIGSLFGHHFSGTEGAVFFGLMPGVSFLFLAVLVNTLIGPITKIVKMLLILSIVIGGLIACIALGIWLDEALFVSQ